MKSGELTLPAIDENAHRIVVVKQGKTDVKTLQEYLTRLRNRKQAQETRKNERIQDELKKKKVSILAKFLGIQEDGINVFEKQFSEGEVNELINQKCHQ